MQITGSADGTAAEEKVLRALGRLPRNKKTEALENALNIRGRANTLTTRRQELMSDWGVSEATLRRYEQAAIGFLTSELLDGYSLEEHPIQVTQPFQDAQPGWATLIEAINGLRQAVEENTALHRKIHGYS